jgi:AcrR family transcriptional regulator
MGRMTNLTENTQAPARWTRRKEARPAEILDAAVAIFAERGFAAARMEDIARRAGVTKGTIYLYFSSKEDVFKSLVRESIVPTIAATTAFASEFEGSSRELLRMTLTAIGTFLRTSDRAVLPKIIISEAGNFPELARFYREEVIDKGLGLIGGIVARGVARGEFRAMSADHAARLAIMPLLFIALWRTSFGKFSEPYDFEGYVETHVETLLRGLEPDK